MSTDGPASHCVTQLTPRARRPGITSCSCPKRPETYVIGPRSLLLLIAGSLLLSACGSTSTGTSSGNEVAGGTSTAGGGSTGAGGGPPADPIGGTPQPSGSNDMVVATPSVAGPVSVMAGSTRSISVTFTSSDGRAISGFDVSGNLATLPAGWSGPGSFTCASVSTGSGCVLNLTYAPTAAGSGTLTIAYVYVDDSTAPSTSGTVTLAYVATVNNNVIAAASPSGQINAVAGGGGQPVIVNFTTDNGYAATNLILATDLTALPSGWSSKAASLSCAIVSTGSGCQLALNYAPTSAARGTLKLDYNFTDDSGAAGTGTLNIPYSAASAGNVVAVASPSGQVNAIAKTGGQAVAVTFTTDDGTPASGLYLTTGLAALPAGWSSASKSFSCASVSTGNGCQLHLTYAPTVLAGGTLTLNYAYGEGGANTGTLNVAYAATTDDNVVGTASPTGQINAVVGAGVQPVSVTFTTDDSRSATALQLTSNLTALPAGWSSPDSTFTCSGLSVGMGCQLPLMYTPMAAGSGMLNLSYSYDNNDGLAKTGTVNIAYRATTNDNIVVTPNLSTVSVAVGASTGVIVTFTTDDGNPASNFSVTSDLGALPPGWSSASGSFGCAAFSTGAACQLILTYAPTVVTSGTPMLSLNYQYNDNSGTLKTGSINIDYSATP
jgi:hypothetical protein